jgi:hypothetical protein
MGNPTIKDIRALSARPTKASKKKRNRQAYDRRQKAKREMEVKEKEERKWLSSKTMPEQFAREVKWAKFQMTKFMERTNRDFNLGRIHHHTQRRGQKVVAMLESEFGRSPTWLTIRQGYGRRAGLNQTQLRHLCKLLVVPYYRQMTTDEMRAVLILLAWKDKHDPEE